LPALTYNHQSLALDGRRLWIVGATLHYARVPAQDWARRIADVAQAGFNTVETPCPWQLHEPRRGRYSFEGQTDLRRFLTLCHEAGLWAMLRVGPYIGDGYDAGGQPAWLLEAPAVALREANEEYSERVSRYLRRLANEIAELQITSGGPVVLLQSEHGWTCANRDQEQRYLNELNRIMRESGINVPILAANDLWSDLHGTINTWRGWDDLLPNVRQLRVVQPEAPRFATLEAAPPQTWGGAAVAAPGPHAVLRRMAEILAAGGQPIVSPFHGGTSSGFLSGQLSGGLTLAGSAAPSAPLGEAGARTPTYQALRRLATFASHFGHVMADLDPDYQPATFDPGGARGMSVVPLRGALGRIVFVFGEGSPRQATLLLDSGVRLPIDLGDQPVGWYPLEVDLHGLGRLDYVNLCPLAIVNRSIVVLFGPERTPVLLSVAGTPLREQVPAGREPLVVEHKGITFVVCNMQTVESVYHDAHRVYVGAEGLDAAGQPVPAADHKGPVLAISGDGAAVELEAPAPAVRRAASSARRTSRQAIRGWSAAPALAQVDGSSPRFATLEGPTTLAACGAPAGYGWYRIQMKVSSARKRLCALPLARDRVHLFVDGQRQVLYGIGPGAVNGAFPLRLARGGCTVVALADNMGHLASGRDARDHKGIFGHLYEVKPLRAIKPKVSRAAPVTPFALRGFVPGLTSGQLSDAQQLIWKFSHARKTPIVVEVRGAAVTGTFVLNDLPLAYYEGAAASPLTRHVLDPATTPGFKRGRNELRFAPDLHQEEPHKRMAAAASLHECVAALSEGAAWSYAKWEPPPEPAFAPLESRGPVKGVPCWYRATFPTPENGRAVWLDTSGLSKGQAYLNGHNLGRYFTARPDGRPVGPQRRLLLHRAWMRGEEANLLVIFDEHGFDPARCALIQSNEGE
jgi:hypothetical protein